MYKFTQKEIYACSHTDFDGEYPELCGACWGFSRYTATCEYLPGVKIELQPKTPDTGRFQSDNYLTPPECPFNLSKLEMGQALKGTGKIYAEVYLVTPEGTGTNPVFYAVGTLEQVLAFFDSWVNQDTQVTVIAAECKNILTGEVLRQFIRPRINKAEKFFYVDGELVNQEWKLYEGSGTTQKVYPGWYILDKEQSSQGTQVAGLVFSVGDVFKTENGSTVEVS